MHATEALLVVLRIVSGVVVLQVLFAFALGRQHGVSAAVGRLTEPMYRPIRWVFPPRRLGVDVSPMVVVMAVTVAGWIIAPDFVAGR